MATESKTKTNSSCIPTGVPGLDTILNGGLPHSRIYLVKGEPGVGKTTLALQFLLEGKRSGEAGMFVTLSETTEELSAIARSHGWSIDGINLVEIGGAVSEAELHKEEEYDVFHPSEVELGEVMQHMFDQAERIKPKRVVLDSLSELRLLARDPLRYRRQLLALKRYFCSRGATVLVLDASLDRGDLQANTMVHGVIIMEQHQPDYGVKRRRLSVAKLRGLKFDDSYHDYRILTGGLDVFPRIVAGDNAGPDHTGKASSGINALDGLLDGGLARGTSTIIMGAAGGGKSSLATQFLCAAAARGEKSVIYCFDERPKTFRERAKSFGLPIDEYTKSGAIIVQQVDPGELSPGEFAIMVKRAVEEKLVRFVVIDSINGYLNATPGERFLLIQLHELLTYLSYRGICSIQIVAQQGMLSSGMHLPVDISYLADTVIMMRYFEFDGHVKKAISVVKNRSGAHEDTIREVRLISGKGIQVGPPLKQFRGVLTGTPIFEGDGEPLLGGDDGGA